MYSLGMATVFMYLGSVISFLLGVQYPNIYLLGFILGAIFFIAAAAILLVMMGKKSR